MKKKLLKYAKMAMAASLIAALTLPSYATVGAADGSAFVTKAEFDAALSDFNARLTTFEAGINSKIDSQVSAYLDRNGIWNGKAQTLVGNLFYNYWYSTTTTVSAYAWTPASSAIGSTTGYKWSASAATCADVTLISNVNKSGLLVMDYDTNNLAGSHGGAQGVSYWYALSSSLFGVQCVYANKISFFQIDINSTLTTINDSYSITPSYYSTAAINGSPVYGTRALQFFVVKDKPLKVTTQQLGTLSNIGNQNKGWSSQPTVGMTTHDVKLTGYCYNIKQATVY